jgi:hypothetical protein
VQKFGEQLSASGMDMAVVSAAVGLGALATGAEPIAVAAIAPFDFGIFATGLGSQIILGTHLVKAAAGDPTPLGMTLVVNISNKSIFGDRILEALSGNAINASMNNIQISNPTCGG